MPFARASLSISDHDSAKYLPVILLLTIGFLLIFPKYISYDFPEESQSSHRYSNSWLSCSSPVEHAHAATKAGLIFSGVTNCSVSFFSEKGFVVAFIEDEIRLVWFTKHTKLATVSPLWGVTLTRNRFHFGDACVEKILHGRIGIALNFIRGANCQDATVFEHRDATGDAESQVAIV